MFQLQNIVSTVNMGVKLDLKKIALHARYTLNTLHKLHARYTLHTLHSRYTLNTLKTAHNALTALTIHTAYTAYAAYTLHAPLQERRVQPKAVRGRDHED